MKMTPHHTVPLFLMLVFIVPAPGYGNFQENGAEFDLENILSPLNRVKKNVEKPDPPKEITMQVVGTGADRIIVFTFEPPDTDFDDYYIRKTTTYYEDSSPTAAITRHENEDIIVDKSETRVEVLYPESTDEVTNVSFGFYTRINGPDGPVLSDPPKPEQTIWLPAVDSIDNDVENPSDSNSTSS